MAEYTKQSWSSGQVISHDKLNHMEDGIAEADRVARIKPDMSAYRRVSDSYSKSEVYTKEEADAAITAKGMTQLIQTGDTERVTINPQSSVTVDVTYATAYASKYPAPVVTASLYNPSTHAVYDYNKGMVSLAITQRTREGCKIKLYNASEQTVYTYASWIAVGQK